MSTTENKELARRLYVEVFGGGNLAAADEILDAACLDHGPGMPPMVGTSLIKRQATALRGAMPDFTTMLEDQLAEGDRVASRWRGSGTFTGEFRTPAATLPPSGKSISFTEIRIDRFLDALCGRAPLLVFKLTSSPSKSSARDRLRSVMPRLPALSTGRSLA